MKKGLIVLLASVLVPASMLAGLISVEGLKKELSNPKVVILDVRGGKIPKTDFANGHIPNSQLIPGGVVAPAKDGLAAEMPDPKKFEAAIQALGVNNDSKIVIVSDGKNAGNHAQGTRLYWTFKNFGAKDLNLLDGGLNAWVKAKEKTALGSPVPVAQKGNFTVVEGSQYPYLATKEDVKKQIAEKKTLIDCRGVNYYLGIDLDKAKGQKVLGHIDTAKFALYPLLLRMKTTQYLPKEQIEAYLSNLRIDVSGETINYCGTGTGASVMWFAISEILGKKIRIYDASMAGWDGPVSSKMQN